MAHTRESVLQNIHDRLYVIKVNKSYVDGKLEDAEDARAAGDWSNAILHLINAVQVGYNSLYWFAYRYDTGQPEYMLWYFLNNFTIAEAEMTWENIIAAWDDAPLQGWARTVRAIDQMRREIWYKPITLGGPFPVFQ